MFLVFFSWNFTFTRSGTLLTVLITVLYCQFIFCSFVVCLGYFSTYYYWFMKWRKGIYGFLSLYRTRKKSIIWFGALLHKMKGFCFLSISNFWNTSFSPLVLYLESKKKRFIFLALWKALVNCHTDMCKLLLLRQNFGRVQLW